MSGIKTDWAPSLGVLAASTVGKVFPPSVESEIFTLAALPLAFQVTLKLVSRGMETAVFGDVTANGVAAPSIVTADWKCVNAAAAGLIITRDHSENHDT